MTYSTCKLLQAEDLKAGRVSGPMSALEQRLAACNIDSQVVDLLQHMLHSEPAARFSVNDCLNHAVLQPGWYASQCSQATQQL